MFTDSLISRTEQRLVTVGFHVTSEKTKIKNFKFLPLSGKSHF